MSLVATPQRKFVVLAGISMMLWLALAFAVAPWLIRSAYLEESLPFLNNMLAGRGVHPVEFYLDTWWALVPKVSAAFLGVVLFGYLGIRHRARIRESFADDGWIPATSAGALLAGGWLGWWTGLLDISYRVLDVAVHQRPRGPATANLWLAPILGTVVTGGLGWIAWYVARRFKGKATLHPVVVVGVGLLFYSWIRLFGLGIHPVAALVLAVGIASQLGRPLVTWSAGFLRFARRTFPYMAVGTVLAAVTITGGDPLSERSATRRLAPARDGAVNVLLLILDTARATSMSLYGAERRTTPNIDRLARSGAVFDLALAPTPWTLPSHATYFTGLHPQDHRATSGTRLGDEYTTLAEILSEQGYMTGGFVANREFTFRRSGLEQGFHRYRDAPLGWKSLLGSLEFVRAPVLRVRGWLFESRYDAGRKHADDVNREFLEWLDDVAEEDRPFFGFLNYFDVHSAYLPHPPFDTLFSPPGDLNDIRGDWNDASVYSDRELYELETAYDEALAFLDHNIGLLFEELERRDELDNTVIVLTSDHGEQFGEHNLLAHMNSLYMPVLHVPLLLIDASGGVPAGVRVTQPAAMRDLASTVLDLLDVPVDVPGESLTRFWSGDSRDEPILTYLDEGTGGPDRWTMRGVVHGRWNYIRNYGGEVADEMYDLTIDPEEIHNLATDPPDEDVRARLNRMRELTSRLNPAPPSSSNSLERRGN